MTGSHSVDLLLVMAQDFKWSYFKLGNSIKISAQPRRALIGLSDKAIPAELPELITMVQ